MANGLRNNINTEMAGQEAHFSACVAAFNSHVFDDRVR
jgi:hypothetical protein